MKIIMTGGGESHHFQEIDQHFISLLGNNPTLLFIPLAGDEDTWDDGLERISQTFSSIEFDNIEMCLSLDELDWDYLKSFSAIYIDGGNTFQLMSKIRENHTYELFHRFLHNGGVINGDSAGAIIMGSHLETAHFGDEGDENESDIISYQGLNLLGKWAIHCHYQAQEKEEILEFVKTYGFPVLALSESTSIYIDNDKLKVIGESKVEVFTCDHVISLDPNMSYSLKQLV